jgi:quaternary ammonium compound-resistance protein SugE
MMPLSWIYLVIAGCLECGWAVGIKYTEGFSRPIPSILTAAAMIASFWLLSLAMKTIPVGTAYAVWTGIGAVGVAVFGIILFDESRDIARILCLLLIIAGVIGLKLFSGGRLM